MTREEAEEYAKNMTYRDAVHNALQGKCVPYRKATKIKLYELLDRLERESCADCISRKSIKHKLQEHHDFFVNAYGGFSNLPQNDKSRVDEILNCIAMVVNEPSIQPKPKTGHWIAEENEEMEIVGYFCSECDLPMETEQRTDFCPNCGCRMVEPQEREGV